MYVIYIFLNSILILDIKTQLQDTKQTPIMEIYCMIKHRKEWQRIFVMQLVFDP